MIVVNKIIVNKLPEGCVECQFHNESVCLALQRDDYPAITDYHSDYRRHDCPMVEEKRE